MKKYIYLLLISLNLILALNIKAAIVYIAPGKHLSDVLVDDTTEASAALEISGYFDSKVDFDYLKSMKKQYASINLTNIVVPNRYFILYNDALKGFDLMYFYLPKSSNVDSIHISVSAFEGNDDMVELRGGWDKIKVIGCKAFKDCVKLNLILPDNIRLIKNSAFAGCASVTIQDGDYSDNYYNDYDVTGLRSNQNVYRNLPDGSDELIYYSPIYYGDITIGKKPKFKIAPYAFYRCSHLTKVNISSTYTNPQIMGIGSAGEEKTEFNREISNDLWYNPTHWDSCTAKINISSVFTYPYRKYKVGNYGELYDNGDLIYFPSKTKGIVKLLTLDDYPNVLKQVDCSLITELTLTSDLGYGTQGITTPLENFTSLTKLTISADFALLPKMINCPKLTTINYYWNAIYQTDYLGKNKLYRTVNNQCDNMTADWYINSGFNLSNVTVYVYDTLNRDYMKKNIVMSQFKDLIPMFDDPYESPENSIKEVVNNNLSVYPAITSTYITIKTNKKDNIYLYNNLGVLIDIIKINDESIKIDVSNLSKGIYYIKSYNKSTLFVLN